MTNQPKSREKTFPELWPVLNIVMSIIGGASYYILNVITNTLDTNEALSFLDIWSPLFMIAEVFFIIMSAFSIYKIKGWHKVIPMVCVIINLGVLFLAGFFYLFRM
jgi:hypothetical protein